MNTIPLGSDAIIRLSDLTDNVSGLLVSDATASGVLVTDGTNDYSFAFQADGTGNYHAVIPAAITETLVQDEEYSIVVTATKGSAVHKLIIESRARVKEDT